jgi:BlaI family penicillinase repressor
MKARPHLSEAEWEVMKVVWQKKSCSAQDIIADLAAPRQWSAATVKTLVNRLLVKKALRFRKIGKAYLYSAVWSEKQCRTREAASFLDRVFDGSLSPMLAHFVHCRRLSKQELQDLEDILKGRA